MIMPPEAIEHALAEYPKESVGYVKGSLYQPLKNVAADPEATFVLSDQDTMTIHQVKADAVVHSHPGGNACPSAVDMESQYEAGIPYGIIVMKGHGYAEQFFFGDQLPVAPLLGRQFRHGVHDCYALVRDWYRVERSVVLPVFPRDNGWWNEGGDLIQQNFAKARFEEVTGPAQVGDVYVMAIASEHPNHLGIDVGQGLVLHHLMGRLSRREPILPWSRHHVRRRLRYAG